LHIQKTSARPSTTFIITKLANLIGLCGSVLRAFAVSTRDMLQAVHAMRLMPTRLISTAPDAENGMRWTAERRTAPLAAPTYMDEHFTLLIADVLLSTYAGLRVK